MGWTGVAGARILATASIAIMFAVPGRVLAQLDIGMLGHGAFVGGSHEAPPRAVAPVRVLDPVSLGAPPIPTGRAPGGPARHDVGIVLLQGPDQGGTPALAEAERYWARSGWRVAPRARVAEELARLGVLTAPALAAADYARLGRMIGTRYLVLLNVAGDGARRRLFDYGHASSLVRLGVAGALVGGRAAGGGHGAMMNLHILALAGAATILAGVSTTATCELAAQIFDCAAGRTIWVGSAGAARRKTFLGLFANRAALARRARAAAVGRLFGGPSRRLRAATSGVRQAARASR